MDELTDKNLVEACYTGDKQMYAVLVKKYYRHVFLVCMGMLGNVSDSEDIAQEVMLKGYVEIKKLRDGEKFAQWITRIAKNMCLNVHRKERNLQKAIAQRAYQEAENPTQNHSLEKAIAKLPSDERLVLLMYYYDGQKVKNVAEKLNISTSNVYLKLRAATNQLHEILEMEGDLK
ncbi:MAG: RNA polymerase sigma factor [Sedimentisphaerales bacterium]|nr:RNA polymerase sigma factor [Sedimentisphaerales bacterium]